ncbi:MAG: ParB/RepB/Spo0J family partition protein [Fimbriimonadaceae bacterium]|nr:ParB/RepB/Spo0J family partition protein [Alphaproteobacteria bacterium]
MNAENSSPRRLGRGLAALIGDMHDEPATAGDETSGSLNVLIAFLKANPRNPRRDFVNEDLDELAESIRRRGIVQPIIVRTDPGEPDHYEIVAGERRWRAAQMAGLHEVPVIVRDMDDREALEVALVENIQRADLNPLEEALGYDQLMRDYKYTQNELGDVIGKSRSHVANMLRLLKLPDSVRAMLRSGELTVGHAKMIVGQDDPEALACFIVEKEMSVREAEALVRRMNQPEKVAAPPAPKDSDTLMLEKALRDALGFDVKINHKNSGTGDVRIAYRSLEQLDHICRLLQGQK